MNTLNVLSSRLRYWEIIKIIILVSALAIGWKTIQGSNWNTDMTMGYIDPSIWLLILIGMICFLVMIALSAWILLRVWTIVGLPNPHKIISQFNYLESCQKLKFLLAAYALLLLAAVGCLVAIC
ncbi:MAG: hypothetical protein WKF66_00180 [Pedobacter sp.]